MAVDGVRMSLMSSLIYEIKKDRTCAFSIICVQCGVYFSNKTHEYNYRTVINLN